LNRNFNIRRILVAPLDWGLGHATRCVPLIKALLQHNYEVIIASDGPQATLLKLEFPQLQFLLLPGYAIRYSRKGWQLPFAMLSQLAKINKAIRREHSWLQDTIKEQKIDLVISDNRFGLYTQQVPCIFITHQLTIKAPFKWLEQRIQQVNYRYINNFTACWVPDFAEEKNIAGVLSHPQKMPSVPVHYVGLLSRFMQTTSTTLQYHYCFLLSGPEPQRTLLENKILRYARNVKGNCLLVRGKPGSTDELHVPSNVTVQNHLSGDALEKAIAQSEYVLSRSGYTTVMEMLSLQKKMILIPTPGQTEQEYLANRLQEQGWCYTTQQQHFDLIKNLEEATHFGYVYPTLATVSLPQLIQQLITDL